MRTMFRNILTIFLFAGLTPVVSADTLIVGNKREHTVSFIDLTTGSESARRTTGKAPHEVAVSPDGKTAVVVSYRGAGYTGNALHVFDIASGTETKIIDLGEHNAPHGLKWIGNTSQVAVTTENTSHLVVADIATGEVVKAITTDAEGSHMVALSPDAKIAYVANIQGGSFSVLDLETGECKKVVNAGKGTEGITVSPDGKHVWVGNNRTRDIMVFDSRTYKRVHHFKTEGIPIRVEMSPNGEYVAVSEADLNRVAIYSAKTRERLQVIDVSAKGGSVPVTLLWAPDGSKLWASTTMAARVMEIDTTNWSIHRVLNAGDGSDGLGYSPVNVLVD